MELLISNTFTDSLGKLTNNEQKAVKTTAFDLQMNPANPGMKLHRIEKAKDANFWSVRVSSDIRLILHKSNASLLLCYVDHHDNAYKWAQSRKIERHPKTGAAQIVEIREKNKEIEVPNYVKVEKLEPSKPKLFEHISDEVLLSYGVPEEWLADVKEVNEDTLFGIAERLPQEATEALLELATGATPAIPVAVGHDTDPFEHPDAKRRFRVMSNVEELRQALDYPWEKWSVFLHPEQRQMVEKSFNGPAKVAGSAGTGKTIVALHRAVFLARQNKDSRVLLTTFSDILANSLERLLRILISSEPRIAERLEVCAINEIGRRLYERNIGKPNLASHEHVLSAIAEASSKVKEHKFAKHFLCSEWEEIVDAWQIKTWEDYRDIKRLGRKRRLAEPQRKILWSIFELVRDSLSSQGVITLAEMYDAVTKKLVAQKNRPFDFAIVDEAQDVSVAQLKFLASLGDNNPNSLFFAGDLGQRIFQQPFSWKSLGVDICGRSKILRINYRTSHQIRNQADRLLPTDIADVDGNSENREGTISVFDGVAPDIQVFDDFDSESKAVGKWLKNLLNNGLQAHEIGVFVRSGSQMSRAKAAVESVNEDWVSLSDLPEGKKRSVSICTMPIVKGMEFRAVAVMACDDEVVPLQERIESVSDESELEEVYHTERHLLYVACTRARDFLLITGIKPVSEFIGDMNQDY